MRKWFNWTDGKWFNWTDENDLTELINDLTELMYDLTELMNDLTELMIPHCPLALRQTVQYSIKPSAL